MSMPRLRRIARLRRPAPAGARRRPRSGRDRLACPAYPVVALSGMRFTWAPPRKPARRPARTSAWCGWSLTPVDARVLERDPPALARRVVAGGVEHRGDRVAAVRAARAVSRSASSGACSETASVTGSGNSASRSMPGTTPTVDTVRWRAEMPTSSCSRVHASSTGVDVGERLAHAHEHDVARRVAATRAARGAPARRSRRRRGAARSRPGPVAQNVQPIAQPACDETHTVARSG